MDYHLERDVCLSEKSKHNLYSWFLYEVDENGNRIGGDHIPWEWSLFFTASELRLTRSIKIEQPDNSEEAANKNSPVEDSESIQAILHPGIYNDGHWLEEINLSMLGTGRIIKDFRLDIYTLGNEDDHEFCRLWGGVSYTANYETTDDIVEISLRLSKKRFNSLSDIIKYQRADVVRLRLGSVSGIYSEPPYSTNPDSVKILTKDDRHKIICPDKCNIKPPRLGEVGSFELSIVQRCNYKIYKKN